MEALDLSIKNHFAIIRAKNVNHFFILQIWKLRLTFFFPQDHIHFEG